MFRLEHDAKLASGHMDALTDLLVDLHLRKDKITNNIFCKENILELKCKIPILT